MYSNFDSRFCQVLFTVLARASAPTGVFPTEWTQGEENNVAGAMQSMSALLVCVLDGILLSPGCELGKQQSDGTVLFKEHQKETG